MCGYWVSHDQWIARGISSYSVHIFIMNFLRLSEQIPDEASSIRFLQQR